MQDAVKVIHVMSDGTVRDSVEGIVVPPELDMAYQIVANHGKKRDVHGW